MRIAPWAVVSLLLLSSALAGCIHTNDPDEVEIIDEQTNNATVLLLQLILESMFITIISS